MSIIATQLPTEIRSYLDRFAARRRWQGVMRAGGVAAAGTMLWVLAWCAVDRLFPLPMMARAVLLAGNVGAVVAILAGPVALLARRTDPARVAAEVEQREPTFAQRLETVTSRAVGPAEWRGSPELLRALAVDVAAEVGAREPGELLPWSPALRPWLLAVGLVALAWVMSLPTWLDLPTLARRYVMPLAQTPAVTTTRLTVTPGDVSIAEGDTLRVRVATQRLGELSPVLHVRSPGLGGGAPGAPQAWSEPAWSEQVMAATPDGSFEARLRNLDRDVEYYVTGGDASSDVFDATVLHKPAIAQFRIRYTYPAYTGLAPRAAQNTTGQIEAPVGTEVELEIDATEPLSLAVMTIGGEGIRMTAAIPTSPGANTQAASFTVREDKRYSIRMASARGVTGAFRAGSIRAIADRPPIVRFLGAGPIAAPTTAPAGAIAPIGYQAVDDYGLSRLDAELFIAHAGGGTERRSIPAPLTHGRQERGTFPLDLKTLGAREGDVIELRLRGEDGAGQFDLTEAMRIAVSAAAPSVSPAATIGATQPAATQPASTQSASTQRASTQGAGDVSPLDPPGFAEALRAYFEALRSRPQ